MPPTRGSAIEGMVTAAHDQARARLQNGWEGFAKTLNEQNAGRFAEPLQNIDLVNGNFAEEGGNANPTGTRFRYNQYDPSLSPPHVEVDSPDKADGKSHLRSSPTGAEAQLHSLQNELVYESRVRLWAIADIGPGVTENTPEKQRETTGINAERYFDADQYLDGSLQALKDGRYEEAWDLIENANQTLEQAEKTQAERQAAEEFAALPKWQQNLSNWLEETGQKLDDFVENKPGLKKIVDGLRQPS